MKTLRPPLRPLFALLLIGLSACASQDEPGTKGPLALLAPGYQPLESLSLCRGIPVSNAPRHDTERRLLDYTPFAALSDGRPILRAPVSDACLSSGFGIRGGREHKGIDLHQRPAGPVVAAAAGRIREIHRRDDFGLQIILDHGKGVFTRYAHLASFAPDLRVGSVVKMGQELGIMGRSGQFTRGVHLHFELLKGRYDTPYKSFGLTAHSVLALPAYRLGSQPNGATPSG